MFRIDLDISSLPLLLNLDVNRYLAIVHPLEARIQQSKSRTVKILVLVWLLPCVGAIPFLHPSEAVSHTLSSDYGTIERLTCFTNFNPSFRKYYFTFLFVFFYVLPLSFITWTCTKIMRCLLKTTVTYREGSLRRQDANRRKVRTVFATSFLCDLLLRSQQLNRDDYLLPAFYQIYTSYILSSACSFDFSSFSLPHTLFLSLLLSISR